MISWITNNSGVIPFAIASICNLWVGIDLLLVKKNTPMAVAFFAYAVASIALCWNCYFTEGA